MTRNIKKRKIHIKTKENHMKKKRKMAIQIKKNIKRKGK